MFKGSTPGFKLVRIHGSNERNYTFVFTPLYLNFSISLDYECQQQSTGALAEAVTLPLRKEAIDVFILHYRYFRIDIDRGVYI